MAQEYSMPSTSTVPFYIQYARFDGGLFYKPNVISGLGATRTLEASESGSIILLDRAAGIVVTLPAPSVGLTFDFIATVSVTSNSYKVITSAGTIFILGSYVSIDNDTSDAAVGFTCNGTTHVAVTMNGTTTGGLLGTRFRLRAVSATVWALDGLIQGNGTVATSCATS